jgi:hypothetical protein
MINTIVVILIIVGLVVYLVIKSILNQKDEDSNPSSEATIVSNIDLNKTTEESKPRTRKTSGVTKGKFEVSGYHYLPDEVKKIVWKQVKVGDKITLIPDPKNQYSSSAIKVIWDGVQIGWYAESGYRQEEIYNSLLMGKDIDVKITKNVRSGDYYTKNGRIEYKGMAQFVEAEFKYQK